MTHLLEDERAVPRTYAQIDREARAIAVRLRAELALGDRVLLLYGPGPEFVAAFFGCLYAGAIAVPVYPPDPGRLERSLPRLLAIVDDARPAAVLTTTVIAGVATAIAGASEPLRAASWITTDDLSLDLADEWRMVDVDGESVAFLQYTSGSTSTPKGVVLSHANLLHNSAEIYRAFGESERSSGVLWLPTYHDMGLIGGVLQPIYGGFPVTLMSPLDFLQRPARWLRAVTRMRATSSGGPNFAYELCVRKITAEERRTLDLSSWELAFTGAEPIRPATLDAFARAFAECGFRREAFYPCYGLAEATLMVSGASRARGARIRSLSVAALDRGEARDADGAGDARELVSSGAPIGGQRVVIVDPETREPKAEGAVGEIWVQGPSVARGYWRREDETREIFGARLASGEGPFLRTGDLGFLDGREVFVTGRRKDLLILRGRNVYPQDLELTADRSHPLVRAGCAAAFAVEAEDGEAVALAVEIADAALGDPSAMAAITEALRSALALEHDVALREILLLQRGAIPKTSSGKIQRSLCRASFLDGSLPVVFRAERSPSGGVALAEARGFLVDELRAQLRASPESIALDEPLVKLGLDSLGAAELAAEVEARHGVRVGLRELLDGVTVRELAERIESARGHHAPAIAAGPRGADAPLSFAQLRLWLLAQLDPASVANIVGVSATLAGPIDAGALGASVDELVARHDVLRATFKVVGDAPIQTLRGAPAPALVRVDLSHLPDDARPAALAARVGAEARTPFDLAAGPLLRALLIVTEKARARLVLLAHHAIADGRSALLMVNELAELYGARVEGAAAPPLPALQYADVARYERAAMAGQVLERSLARWRERLSGAPPLIDVPTDFPRPARLLSAGARVRRSLDGERVASLRALARGAGTTPFMVILAGVAVVLQRWARQDDLVIGTITSTRTEAALRGVVGDFTNFLPIRVHVAAGDSGRSLIGCVREALLDAFAHGDCPFEKIVEAVRPSRTASHNPLYNVSIVDHGYAEATALRFGSSVTADVALVDNGTAEVDLAFEVFHAEGGELAIECRYSVDLFAAETISRMLVHLERVLAGMIDDPDARARRLPLLGEAEVRTLLDAWNDTAVDYGAPTRLHTLVEAQVDRTPEAVAVTFEGESILYGELDTRANQLAHHLRALGVGRETLVGVCLERSIEMVVALLAILKAGGAYVPLDPDYPRERLAFMREDARVAALVTERRFAGDAGDSVVVLVDEHHDAIARRPTSRPAPIGGPSDLAYVIYTSGSTGRPKGAMNEHRAIANRILWMQNAYRLDASDAILQKTPFSFDVSVWEFFWPLMSGARLIIARPGGHRDTSYLVDVIRAEGVTTLHFVPSMLQAMLEDERFSTCASIRRVVCSGEALSADLQERYYAALDAPLYNLYGPTEAAVDVTAWRCRKGDRSAATVSIGAPIANARVYVLDDEGELLPIGARGELCIGGVAVGRGYLRRPDLTAEHFRVDPYAGAPGATLYRTGDEVRLRSDGTIDYLGRLDTQVKLRGYRIELGEIRAVLEAQKGVREAAVIIHRGPGGDRLAAYVVPSAPTASASELESSARKLLPEYMVPAAFVFLDALPLTPSGKLDARALPPPPLAAPPSAGLPPRGAIEEIVAGIAAELLGLPSFGVHDDFFAYGGHSLLATQLVARVRRALGVEVSLAAFFAAPTIAALAESVQRRAASGVAIPPPRPMPRDGDVPLSFAQERLWFLSQLDPEITSYHVPRALRLRGALSAELLERAFRELLRRHEILRTTFPMVGDRPVQRVQPDRPVTIPIVDLRHLTGDALEDEVQRIVLEEGRRRFSLERGPMVRLCLVRCADDDHMLVMTEHHLVHDGWTQGVFAQDFLTIYEAFARGEPSPLPDLPLQYADYTLWQRSWLRDEAQARLVAYWRERLAGLPALDLPTDRPRPAVSKFRGAELRFEIKPRLAQSLRALSHREGSTLFMTLLAAFDALIARYARQDDIAVGIAVANRRWEELEALVGMMINTIVHRCDLSGDPTFRDILARVRRGMLEDYAHQDLPFEKLVEAIRPARSLSHMPLTQVWFGFQDVPEPMLRLPGLQIEVVYRHNGSAKNDLSLMLVPHAEQRVGTIGADEERGLVGLLEYNTDIYDAASIARFVDHFLALLEAVARDPSVRLRDLELASAEEVQRATIEWNRTAVPLPRGSLVQEAFEAHARQRPAALAIRDHSGELTYAELDAHAELIAAELKRLGVSVGARVAVCADRGAALIAALLGALKAGAAYVPIDPASPASRAAYILDDARASVALVAAELEDRLASYDGPRITLTREGALSAVVPGRARPHLTGERAAYILYTSGSTGRPKGVEIPHEGIVNLVAWHRRTYAVSSEDCATLIAGPAFDASSWEIWAYLSSGASLHAPDVDTRANAPRLVEWIVAERITLAFLPTPLAEAALAEPWPASVALRALLTGGDALRRRPRPGLSFALFNHYGPTEVSVVTTWAPVSPDDGEPAGAPSIGWPIDNLRVYLLDEGGRVVPTGVRGEICISGVGLARGYVGDAEREPRFVPNPYEPGERMYRTGDLARHREDGALIFAGRIDNQVKLRGHRIELGEIEAVLGQHPKVSACAVALRGEGASAHLVAYFTASGDAPEDRELRSFLAERLPAVMAPSIFARLDALPVTVNGKIDRAALPAVDGISAGAYVAPRTPTEQKLASIWGEVLGVERVGVHDDFFALGGHSLLATRILSRARSLFEVDVPLRAVFQTPTIAELAATIDMIQVAARRSARPATASDEAREEGDL